MIQAGRKNDALVSVVQRNADQLIEITDLNRAAESLFGYPKKEIVGQPLQTILSEKLQEDIKDYVDFEANGTDVSDVLMRARKCSIVTQSKQEVPVNIKPFHGVSEGKDPVFEILFRDVSLFEKIETFKEELVKQNINYKAQTTTGMPSHQDFMGSLQLVSDFVQQHNVEAVFGLVAIDHIEYFASKPLEEIEKLVKRMILHMRVKARQEDLIGYVNQNRFGVVLFDCNSANAQRVFERLHDHLHFDTGFRENNEPIILHTSIAFQQIKRTENIQNLLSSCDKILNVIQFQGGNQVREVETSQFSISELSSE